MIKKNKSWEYLKDYDKETIIAYLNENCYFERPTKERVEQFARMHKHKKILEEMNKVFEEIQKTDYEKEPAKWLELHKKHIKLSEQITKLYEE